MYNVIVFNTDEGLWRDYTVTRNENIFNGYPTRRNLEFYSEDECGCFRPVDRKEEFIIRKGKAKSSVYRRDFLECDKTKYDYAFNEKTTRTTVTDRDVYYNSKKDRFLTKTKTSYSKKTEYGMPSLITW